MISEKIPLRFDIEKLREHVLKTVLPFQPVMMGEWFGGWSVLSADGTYVDGWKQGFQAFQPTFMPGLSIDEKLAALGIKKSAAHIHPTEICVGYLAEVINTIRERGLQPMRARVSLLKARGKSTIHRDAPDSEYAVRLHIPIITNEKCLFKTEEGSVHLPAGGDTYLLRVNRMHQVVNDSDEDRLHLIMSVLDTKGVSEFHRFPPPSPSVATKKTTE